jgi:exonuclease III
MFPEIQAGDVLTFEILTSGHKAKLTLNAIIDFQPGHFYTFPLTLSNYGADKMTIETRTDITASGTFTCATYNVDGLPAKVSFITINEDGPGSEGTKEISQKIASSNWDFVGFSEDFEYNTELQSALTTDYAFGTHAGSYSTSSTDGLNFAVRKSNGVTFSNETRVAFKDSYGGLTSGANTSITKGFRYYLVKLADGTEVDVIITHMNTYSSSGTGHINAQHAQLTQIAEYIKGLMTDSTPRPVILMGDTNCRYTRHDFQTHFWSKLNGYTVLDPWVEYWWDGIYPEYSTSAKSLVVEDATGTNSSTDIIYSSQQGEVVDKVIYINDPKASVQISANSYLRDPDYKGLADHWPIVVEFTYEKYK